MASYAWIEGFLEAALAEKSIARNTFWAYKRDLEAFCGFLGKREKNLETASAGDVTEYVKSLRSNEFAQSTVSRKLAAIRQLYVFACEEGLRSDNPALQIKNPKPSRKLPKILSVEEVEKLIAATRMRRSNNYKVLRDRCLIELLYSTGMRISELVSLPVALVRGYPETIVVTGKGGKERMVLLSPPALEAIRDWIEVRDAREDGASRKVRCPSEHLFPALRGTGHMSRVTAYLILRDIAVRAGIDPRSVSPHVVRHAFATHLLSNGADLRSIQTLLGHSEIETTQIYTHVVDRHLKSTVYDRHPLAVEHGSKE